MNNNNYQFEYERGNVLEHLLDLLERFAVFATENRAYLLYLSQKIENGELTPKAIDPQDIFKMDRMLQTIEDENREDAFEDFDRLKYTAEVYHQFRRFRDEMQEIQVGLLQQTIHAGQRLIAAHYNWLDNVEFAIAQNDTDVPSEEEIKSVKEGLETYRNEVTLQELQLKTLHPWASN